MHLALIHDGRVQAETDAATASLGVFDIRDVSGVAGIEIGWIVDDDGNFTPPPTAPSPTIEDLRDQVVAAASAACDSVSGHIIPDATRQNAYSNAATIVWANGGNAPSVEPAKSIFAAQGASVGINSPADFAKVVVTVSLGSMQLATILSNIKGNAENSKSARDLASALNAFQVSLKGFVSNLNNSGLTVSIPDPPPIIIPGIA